MANTEQTVQYEVSASEIAKQVSPPTKAPRKYLVFGKAFEEAYTYMTYVGRTRNAMGGFCSDLKQRLENHGVEDEELVTRGYRMASCLLDADAQGRKPKTRTRDHKDVKVFAQPDLIHETPFVEYFIEFKTGSIDDYARAQSQVFSWVIDSGIKLIGLHEGEDGYVSAEDEWIDEVEIDIDQALEEIKRNREPKKKEPETEKVRSV